jgi:5,10-methylene-tetrahydrofolate dehydrogenase/methenyl tetrahydrofolate cyclohydrolase
VGDNPASATYVASKKNISAQSGRSIIGCPPPFSEAELLALIVA